MADELQGYWSALSQLAAIAALALVVEVRLNAREWLRKSAELSEQRRLLRAVPLIAIGVALTVSEAISLLGLAATGSVRSLALPAGISAVVGFAGVVIVPITSVLAVALEDFWFRASVKIPWSKPRRLVRAFVRQQQDYRLQVLSLRAVKIDLLQERLGYFLPEMLFLPIADSMFEPIGSVASTSSALRNAFRRELEERFYRLDFTAQLEQIDLQLKSQDLLILMCEQILDLAIEAPRRLSEITPEALERIRDSMRTRLGAT